MRIEEAEGAEAAAFAGPVVLAIRRGEVHRQRRSVSQCLQRCVEVARVPGIDEAGANSPLLTPAALAEVEHKLPRVPMFILTV